MSQKQHAPISIERDSDEYIYIHQTWGGKTDIIICTQDTAFKLAYKILSFAHGQGWREEEIVE